MPEENNATNAEAGNGTGKDGKDAATDSSSSPDNSADILSALSNLEKKLDANTLSAEDTALLEKMLNEEEESDKPTEKPLPDYDKMSNSQLIDAISSLVKAEVSGVSKASDANFKKIYQHLADKDARSELRDVAKKRGDLFTKLKPDMVELVKQYPALSADDALMLAAARKDPSLLIPKKEAAVPNNQGRSFMNTSAILEGISADTNYKDAAKHILDKIRQT